MTTTPQPVERLPLTQLAAAGRSGMLARIVPDREEEPGPERVSVAAFQSAV